MLFTFSIARSFYPLTAARLKRRTTLAASLLCLALFSQSSTAQSWQLSAGVAASARQQPWQDIQADYQLLPMFSARYGNWQIDTTGNSLASYSWQFPAGGNLQLGLGIRDLGYGAKTQPYKKLSAAAVFRGYQRPEPEAVLNLTAQWHWFFLNLGQQLNDQALAFQTKAGVQLPLWQQHQGASLALLLEARYSNQALNQRIYGVAFDNQDLSVGRPQFNAGEGINSAIALQLNYPLTQRWQLLAMLSTEQLDDKLRNSPLLEQHQITEVLLALNYYF